MPERLLRRLRKIIADEAVQIRLDEESTWEASQVSQVTSPIYENLALTVRQVFPDAVVAPYLLTGATDSRYYTTLCPNVFRFSPYKMDSELLKTIHGTNERISIENLEYMVQFYTQLIKSWTTVVGSAA
jgi:carboxypeptidase PM20D1